MSAMSIEELYNKLQDDKFKNTASGALFYNFFVFQYPASEEYAWRKNIQDIQRNLQLPANYLDTLCINLFDEFCAYLDSKSFGKKWSSKLLYYIDKESHGVEESAKVQQLLTDAANEDKGPKEEDASFIKWVNKKIKDHLAKSENANNKPYIFIHGIGQMFPYLRANVFLTKFEPYNEPDKYKIILFYPGCSEGNKFKLFDVLNDDHTYRAHVLINGED